MKAGKQRKLRQGLALLLTLTMLAGVPGLSALAAPVDDAPAAVQSEETAQLRLWYDEPSSQTGTPGGQGNQVYNQDQNIWQQDTLPIGSGDLGANIYGEIATERVTLNEKTLWTQGPTEQNANYNGGNIISNGRNGEALKEVEEYFKTHPDEPTVPRSMTDSFLGAVQGYGYYAPWGELDITYDSLATVTETNAATEGCAVNAKDRNHINNTDFTFVGTSANANAWYAWSDGAGRHHGPGKVETEVANAYFTYSFTVPAGEKGKLDLYSHTGNGTFTLSFTEQPSGSNLASDTATLNGGLLKSYSDLIPGSYTIKGVCSGGKVNLDYVKLTTTPEVTDYTRWLTLDDALAGVQFTAGGVTYHREFLASHPDSVIAAKLTATSPMDLTIAINKGGDMNTNTVAVADDTLKLAGAVTDNDMKYNSYLKVAVPDGGGSVTKNSANTALVVTGATEVTLFFTAATDYKMVYPDYRTGETDAELDIRVKGVLDKAVGRGYDNIRADHIADYHTLYDRMSLDLGQGSTTKTTDQLLKDYNGQKATEAERRLLEVMLFQYGRYLLISSSREDSQLPANLQGVWNNRQRPTWNSDYHINVNLQMNYWPVYNTNLTECVQPLVNFVEGLRIPGRITAEVYAGVKSTPEDPEAGFMSHTQTTPFGWTCPGDAFSWGWSPASTPWIIQNVWERYEYTRDLDYMRNYIYPMLKEEARLYDGMLLNIGTEEEPVLVSAPSYSPETGPMGTAGNTYEHSLIWQLYEDACTAAEQLGVDSDYVETWRYNQAHLKGPIEIGASGQIKEWYHEDKFNKDANGNTLGEGFNHRHLSHMLGLYPGDLVQKKPEWIEAARVSMENRSDSATGWGTAQRINTWARLRDGNRVMRIIVALFNTGIYNNLWDAHPPFQIDGNLGYTAGVAEMLLQSNMGFIDLLPALPDAWADGSYSGMLARGNFVVGATWAGKALTSATITSQSGGECVVAYPNIAMATVKDAGGNLIDFTVADETGDKISFNTAKGQTYTITGIPAEGATIVENAEALRTSDKSVTVNWKGEEGVSYQLYRQADGGDILPVGDPTTAGTMVDEEAYEVMGEITYYLQAEGCSISAAIPVQDLQGMDEIDNVDSRVKYVGSGWFSYRESGFRNDTSHIIESEVNDPEDAGQTIELTFLGTGIEVYGGKRYFHGMMAVEIDGVEQSEKADFYVASGHPMSEKVWSIEDLPLGIHTIKLTRLYDHNPNMGNNTYNQQVNKIEFDYFKVLGGQTETPVEGDLEITAVGGVEKLWKAGDTVKFTSTLEGVTWTVTSSVTHASTCIYPAHKFSWDASTQTLTAGRTDEVVTVTATKGDKTDSKTVTITPQTTVTIVEDSLSSGAGRNPAITWSGSWAPYWGEPGKHHGGSKTENGTSFTYTFTGTGVAVFAQKNGDSSWSNNSMTAVLDEGKTGAQTKNCSTYDSSLSPGGTNQQKLVEFLNLSNGQHTIKISGSGTGVNVDFIEVYAPNPNAPTVDLTALKEAVAECGKLNEASYTTESWAALKTALEEASALLNGANPDATADDVTAAVGKIADKKGKLVAKPLDKPENLTLVQKESAALTLKWDAVARATGYAIFVDGEEHATSANTSCRITGLEPGVTYTITVKATNDSPTPSPASDALSVATLDNAPPSKVSGLEWNEGTKTLRWDESTDNVGVTGYKVMVTVGETTTTKNATDTSIVLDDIVSSQQTSIKVMAVDAAGNESVPATLVIAPTYTVTVTAGNATVTGGKTAFKEGEAVEVTAVIPAGHVLTSWTATGLDLAADTKDTTLRFSMPAQDVTLTATTEAKTWNISATLTNLTIPGLPSTANHGDGLTVSLVAPSPYRLPSTITVTMGGVVQPAPFVVYSSVDGTIKIKEITGDIEIVAENAIQSPTGENFTASDRFGLPTAEGETTKLQVEYMERTGNISVPDGPGFKNKHISGFVDGTSLKLYYNAPVAGRYTMTLNYRSARNDNNQHTLGWTGENVEDYAVRTIPSTLENGTGTYKSIPFEFTVTTAGEGEVTFTTSSTGDGPELDWALFELEAPDATGVITDIALTRDAVTLYVNKDDPAHSVELTPTVTPSTSQEIVVWSSSDPKVAYVEQDGTVTARAVGTTVIKAAARHDETICDSITVTVKEKLSGTVSIVPDPKFNTAVRAEINQLQPQAAKDTLTYQWKRNGVAIAENADQPTYTPVKEDIKKELTVEVTAADPYEGSVTSPALEVAKAAGEKLTSENETPTHVDCSETNKNDGQITGLDCGRVHEYKLVSEPESAWRTMEDDPTAAVITGLAPGDYHVRHAETETHTAGPVSRTVTILSVEDSTLAHNIHIAAAALEGGQVTASTRRALPGVTVTLTVTPEDSHTYQDDLAVTWAKSAEEPITVTPVEDAESEEIQFTFTMPDGDVDVTATFAIKEYTISHALGDHITCEWEDGHDHTVEHGEIPEPVTLKAAEGYEVSGTVKLYTTASYDPENPTTAKEFGGYQFRLNEDKTVGTVTFNTGVTADLVVVGNAVLKTYNVFYQIPGLKALDQPRDVDHHESLDVKLRPVDEFSSLPETVSLAMGGEPLDEGKYMYTKGTDAEGAVGTIHIDPGIITGDIIIDAVGESTLPALTSVTIDGIPSVGQRLEARILPEDATRQVQWMRVVNGVRTEIEGATTARYTLTGDDEGATILVRVTGTGNYGGTIFSDETATVDRSVVVDTEGVSLDVTSANVTINGNTLTLHATLTPENATNKAIRWSSSDTSVATVSETTGVVRGVGLGKATITVTTINGGHKATCEVTVVAITLKDLTMKIGETAAVEITIPDDLRQNSVTWESSDEEVATVDEEGNVTALKAGKTTITATTDTGYSDQCTVTVRSASTSSNRPITETKTEPDGTKVTTVTDKRTGTVTETTEKPDGTTEIVETKKDGTVTETVETPDGAKEVVETKPDGTVTETVTDPEGAKTEKVTTPDEAVTITVTDPEGEEVAKVEIPAEIPEPEEPFVDVDGVNWAKESINSVAGLGLVKGIGDQKYDPIAPMTRGSLATVLHRLSQGKTDYESTFKDVAKGQYYTEGVAWAAKVKVVTGYTPETFAPDDIITREQLAVMLARYAKLIGMDTTADKEVLDEFVDGEKTGPWAVDGMAWAVKNGILKGKGANDLDPTAKVSRAEVAVMLDRFIDLIK